METSPEPFRLPDGRLLGYHEYGDPSGTPLVYFHGTPGSRLELAVPAVRAAFIELGVRTIAIDRPGFGLSSFVPNRRIADWPRDVALIADGLGLERFAVLGVSGGGPYALACAHALADRVTAVGAVASIGPTPRDQWASMPARARHLLRMGRWFPPALRWALTRLSERVAAQPEVVLTRILAAFPEADRLLLSDRQVWEAFVTNWREAFRQGPLGPAREVFLLSRNWGFDLGKIEMPVLLWVAGEDRTIPTSMGQDLARRIPRSETRVYPSEGHFSIGANRVSEIVALLLHRGDGGQQSPHYPSTQPSRP